MVVTIASTWEDPNIEPPPYRVWMPFSDTCKTFTVSLQSGYSTPERSQVWEHRCIEDSKAGMGRWVEEVQQIDLISGEVKAKLYENESSDSEVDDPTAATICKVTDNKIVFTNLGTRIAAASEHGWAAVLVYQNDCFFIHTFDTRTGALWPKYRINPLREKRRKFVQNPDDGDLITFAMDDLLFITLLTFDDAIKTYVSVLAIYKLEQPLGRQPLWRLLSTESVSGYVGELDAHDNILVMCLHQGGGINSCIKVYELTGGLAIPCYTLDADDWHPVGVLTDMNGNEYLMEKGHNVTCLPAYLASKFELVNSFYVSSINISPTVIITSRRGFDRHHVMVIEIWDTKLIRQGSAHCLHRIEIVGPAWNGGCKLCCSTLAITLNRPLIASSFLQRHANDVSSLPGNDTSLQPEFFEEDSCNSDSSNYANAGNTCVTNVAMSS